MADEWARVCYRSPVSKWPDGFARSHWMPLAKAKEAMAIDIAHGGETFIEIADPLWNRAASRIYE